MIADTHFIRTESIVGSGVSGGRKETSAEVNCTNTKAVYHYVRRHKPGKIAELFENLPAPYDSFSNIESYIIDENNWVTSELVTVLFRNAVRIFGDPSVAFHIGIETVTTRSIGFLQGFLISTFSSPMSLLKRLNQINQQFNTTKITETVYQSRTRAVVRLHWKDGRVLSKDLCLYNQGIYAAIPTLWGRPMAAITETECFFSGSPYCQFNINFEKKIFPYFNIRTKLKTRKTQLLLALEEIENDKLLLKKKNEEVIKLNIELKEKVERLKAINEASRLLVSMADSDEILRTTMDIIVDVLKFDRALLMLVDQKNENLEYAYSTGANREEVDRRLKNYKIPLSRTGNILVRSTLEGKPLLVKDSVKAGLNPENLIIRHFSPDSIAFCPLITSKGSIGILAADRVISRKSITEKELEHLSIFVNSMAATLYKTRQDKELEKNYLNTVKALVKAIEEKDPYTRGHSERVSRLAVRIAGVMDLPEKEIDFIRIGSLLHDVGKIGIPESIVKSPKRLTKAEFNIIKTHPLRGCEIIEPIRFLSSHHYLIRNHHEHYDGSGYPDGLKGEKIPLGAQIISIADTYDAITSSRAYRKGLPKDEAAARILAAENTQFSPRIVKAFMQVYYNEIIPGILEL